jgi:thiamine-phosphate pyrophosphorylase
VLLYYITDRTQLGNDKRRQCAQLLDKIEEAAQAGVDYIQLRERDLPARECEALAGDARTRIPATSKTKLLVNSRIDIALAIAADGVHLRADDINAAEARTIFAKSATPKAAPVISVSCHTPEDVALAEAHGADFAVFAPVFEKDAIPCNRLDDLRRACTRPAAAAQHMPVLALGGVTGANAADCLRAGAAGIAGIRLFQQDDIASIVELLSALTADAVKSHERHPYFRK